VVAFVVPRDAAASPSSSASVAQLASTRGRNRLRRVAEVGDRILARDTRLARVEAELVVAA
jgi:hypothetical protein